MLEYLSTAGKLWFLHDGPKQLPQLRCYQPLFVRSWRTSSSSAIRRRTNMKLGQNMPNHSRYILFLLKNIIVTYSKIESLQNLQRSKYEENDIDQDQTGSDSSFFHHFSALAPWPIGSCDISPRKARLPQNVKQGRATKSRHSKELMSFSADFVVIGPGSPEVRMYPKHGAMFSAERFQDFSIINEATCSMQLGHGIFGYTVGSLKCSTRNGWLEAMPIVLC